MLPVPQCDLARTGLRDVVLDNRVDTLDLLFRVWRQLNFSTCSEHPAN